MNSDPSSPTSNSNPSMAETVAPVATLPVLAWMARRDDWPGGLYEPFGGVKPPAWSNKSFPLCDHTAATQRIADLEREAIETRAILTLCQRRLLIAEGKEEAAEARVAELEADAQRLHELLDTAQAIVKVYANGNRPWRDTGGAWQDPMGAHAWLAALSQPLKEQES